MTDTRNITVEEVDSVEAPKKVRVNDTVDAALAAEKEAEAGANNEERQKDYLEGFLAQTPSANAAGQPGGEIYDGIIETLREIYDPEIPVNIYDLGLIYGVEVTDDGHAIVSMTLTTPNCPVAETMPGEVEMQVGAVPGVGHAEVNLVWDPPWDPGKMSDDAKLELGML
ncbi:MAG: SUF system Fe-S cluster assembly protein [Pseudomonadota bacterium]